MLQKWLHKEEKQLKSNTSTPLKGNQTLLFSQALALLYFRASMEQIILMRRVDKTRKRARRPLQTAKTVHFDNKRTHPQHQNQKKNSLIVFSIFFSIQFVFSLPIAPSI